ncbi:MAG: DUF1571 domain-containing protein, partial [Phycisphaerae bacterium]
GASSSPAARAETESDSARLAALEELAATDPLAFLRHCRRRYERNVRDYRCRFHKRERRGGVLPPEEEMQILFREEPYSVDMRWVRNPGMARRVNYVAGRWVKNGKELMLVQPAGWIGLLVPNGVKRDIHGPQARRAARSTIDRFGFKHTLDTIIACCERSAGDAGYDLRYVGPASFDGRPTLMLERRLPYTGPDGPYPDRLLVMHIDQEWLVPVACYGYADDLKQVLTGSYLTTSVEMNVGLDDDDFATP